MIRDFPAFPLLVKHDYDSTWDFLAEINEIARDESIDEHGNWVDEISIISKDNQAAVLYEIAANHHSPNNTRGYCLELGTFEGGSTAIIGSALRIRPHLSLFPPVYKCQHALATVDQAYQSKAKWERIGTHSPNNTRGYCLELGTFEGGSTAIIGSALRIRPHLSLPLFTVDQAYQSKAKQRWNTLDIYDKICYVI